MSLTPGAAWRRLHEAATPLLLLAPTICVLLALFVGPVWRTLVLSLGQGTGAIGLDWYTRFVTSPGYRADLVFTLWTAALAVFGCMLLGLPSALALRAGGRGSRALYVAVLTPLLVPHLIAAYALRLTLSPHGPLATVLVDRWHLLSAFPQFVNQWTGLVVALVWKFFPVMTLTLLSGLESIPDSVYDAARDLGAGALRRLGEITIPLLIPGLLAGSVLVFIMAASQFSVTLVIYGAGKLTTIPVDIYILTFGQNQYSYASALGLVLTAVTLGLLGIVTGLVRRVTRTMLGEGVR